MKAREGTLEQVLASDAEWCVVQADTFSLLPTMTDQSVDVVISDPPYDEFTHGFGKSTSTWSDARPQGIKQFEPLSDAPSLAGHLVRVAKRWAVAFCALEQLSSYRSGIKVKEWVRSGVWDKIVPGPQVTADRPGQAVEGLAIMHREGKKRWNRGGGAGIWRQLPAHGKERFDHPSPKPIKLMLDLVADFSEPGEVIFDPFAGTGTTGVAALRLGRRVILVEQLPEFVIVCRKRLLAEANVSNPHSERVGQNSLFDERVNLI